MFKDDFIMKIIRQASMVFHRVLGLVNADQLDEAEATLGEAAMEYLGMDWETVEANSAEMLISLLGNNDQAGLGQMIMLADLLRAQGIIHTHDELEESAYASFLKALQVRLSLTIGHDLSNAHLDATIDELVDEHLGDYLLPTSVVQQLFIYYEKTTQLDQAEEVLWELVEEHITETDIVQYGLEFYERLLQKTDTDLATGSITREQVQKGFDDLWEKR
ncbi:MAG: DUF6483 family protein [Candidatus Promineifilaceae bacterium]